jgi:hypothetical protein
VTSAKEGHPAEAALDGDPETAWCPGVGTHDQLVLRFEEPVDLQWVGVDALGVRRVELRTAQWDQVFVTFEDPPAERDGARPPSTALSLEGVEVVSLEITHLHAGGSPCVAELAFAGVPAGGG